MKKFLACLLALVMVFALCACGNEAEPPATPTGDTDADTTPTPSDDAAEGKEVTIGFANASMNNGFFVTINSTLESLCGEKGYEYVMYDCDWDNELQISQVEDLVNLGVSVIFLAPADADGTRAGLEAADAAGIPVIVLDNPVNDDDNTLVAYTVASDNYQAGEICAQMMLADYPDGAKVALLNHSSNNAARARIEGFSDAIADMENYEIVAELYGEGTIEDSIEPAEDILQAHPEVDVFMPCNELSGMGALTAVEAAGRTGEIKIYTVDASPDGKELIIDGSFAGEAAQSPIGIATKAFELAESIIAGTEPTGEKFLIECFEVRVDLAKETQGAWQ